MSKMNLSVCSIPFSEGGAGAIGLIVSVTDDAGAPFTGLQKANFNVHWLLDGQPVDLKSVTVAEFKAANGLTPLPGVYDVEAHSKGTAWVRAKVAVSTFFIGVKEDNDHGQILYTPADELLPL